MNLIEQLYDVHEFCILFVFNSLHLNLNFVHEASEFILHIHSLAIRIEPNKDPFPTMNHIEIVISDFLIFWVICSVSKLIRLHA